MVYIEQVRGTTTENRQLEVDNMCGVERDEKEQGMKQRVLRLWLTLHGKLEAMVRTKSHGLRENPERVVRAASPCLEMRDERTAYHDTRLNGQRMAEEDMSFGT